ncbi:MAG: beta-N-acetylglucosaminidase domain-containing protein [Bacteroidaceae bacterium]|nr:beta-N-acetylglucosaminidase domain-containing protein [Bacteroidaceae bacterium]
MKLLAKPSLKRALTLFMFVCLACNAYAQAPHSATSLPNLHPGFKDITYTGDTLYSIYPQKIVGESTCDAAARDELLKGVSSFAKGNSKTKYVIGCRGEKAVKAYEAQIPKVSGGYLIKITRDKVIIAANDAAGEYYGVRGLLALMKGKRALPCCEIRDWPSMPERGIIEGFYGNPYTHAERLSMFQFMGSYGMNVYVYGPKDDPYHRTHWRDPYPAKEASLIKELAETARYHHVEFVWAIHPGLDIQWNKADSLAILHKLEKMYDIGVRAFCVFFDDIGGEGTRAEKQADLLNFLHREFVMKHQNVAPLMMCPTQYNKSWTRGDYLHTLGTRMDPSVRIMWTGATVVDMIERDDMAWINEQINRKAYIWLNYPVTDYCIDHLLMGPTYGNGLDIAPMVSGFCSNPMEYAEASKISLFSIAEYTWNTPAYDAHASWNRAINFMAQTGLDEEALRIFCENNVDLGATGHGLRRYGESTDFPQTNDEDSLRAWFAQLKHASQMLIESTQAGTTAPALSQEISPWFEAGRIVAERGLRILNLRKALAQRDSLGFIQSYVAYTQLTEQGRALRSRDFSGSIKTAAPVVATLRVEPWLRAEAKRLEKEYRQAGYTYQLNVFPVQLIPDGTYFIKCDGKYLTDVTPQVPGAQALFVAERDTINPQRQEWTIELSPATNRYSLVCNQNRRYLNEVGRFGTNPYNELWNTYQITKAPNSDGFLIRNAQNGGTAWWRCNNEGNIGFSQESGSFFEIIPADN